MAAKFGRAWIRKDMPRGAWYYDGEIDLGFGGALRAAATIVANDPFFGWLAYGGRLQVAGQHLEVVPRDGLRKRLAMVLKNFRLKLELDRDGWAAEKSIVFDQDLKKIHLWIENRTSDSHKTLLKIYSLEPTKYLVWQKGKPVGELRPSPEAEINLIIDSPLEPVGLVQIR